MRKLGLLALLLCLGCDDATGLDFRKPEVLKTPSVLDFGTVYVGGQATKEITISNSGDGTLRLEGTVTSTGFSLAQAVVFVPPNGDHAATITFSPTQVGNATSTLTFQTNLDAPITVELRGVGAAPLPCDDSNECTQDTFDPNVGTCTRTPVGGNCDDGSACTANDRCVDGECAGAGVSCDDGVACTQDLCDPEVGCVWIGDDTRCDDNDPCTVDQCASDGCQNRGAPDGHLCGDVVSCVSAQVCLLRECVEVSIPDGAPCDDSDTCTAADQCSSGVCEGTPVPRPPTVTANITLIEDPRFGQFVGDHLYVSAPVDGAYRFKTVRISGLSGLTTSASRDLPGTGPLAVVGPNTAARITRGGPGQSMLQIIDLSNRDQPTLLREELIATERTVATSLGSELFFCTVPTAAADPRFTRMDLSSPSQQAAPIYLDYDLCDGRYLIARGDIWIAASATQISIYRLNNLEPTLLVNHSFEPNGTSQYGAIRRIETDGHVVIVDLENESTFFTFDLDNQNQLAVVRLPALPVHDLLAVGGRMAFFGAGTQIVAYDFTDPSTPVALPWSVPTTQEAWHQYAFGAADGTRFAFADAAELRIIVATPTRADEVQIRGKGVMRNLFVQPSAAIGIGPKGVTYFDRSTLFQPGASATMVRRPVEVTHLIDGPDGPAGIYATPFVETGNCPLCDRTTPFPLMTELAMVTVSASGTTFRTSTSTESGGLLMGAAEGCIGIGAHVAESKYVTFDRCASPRQVQPIGEVATPQFRPWQSWVRLHPGGFASFVQPEGVVVVDYRVPTAPVLVAEQALPWGWAVGSEFDGQHWVVSGPSMQWGGSNEIHVYEVATNGMVTETGRASLSPLGLNSHHREQYMRWPHLYIGMTVGNQAQIGVVQLDRSEPQLIHTIDVDSQAYRFIDAGNELFVVRTDGLTVLEPACGN